MSSENPPTPIMYGSGLLPTSIMRVDDSVGKAKPKYDQEKRYGDRDILRDSAVESWAWREKAAREGEENRIEIIPVEVDGFKRKYNLESSYGGTMLDIERNENEEMNAVVISGLTEEEKDKLDSSESSYETATLDLKEVEPYLEEHIESLRDEFENNEVEIYIGEPKTTNRCRNQTYHDRIRTGIDMIGEIYGERLAEEMWKDFKETTYETTIPGINSTMKTDQVTEWNEWSNTLEENDRAEEAFSKLMNDKLLEN